MMRTNRVAVLALLFATVPIAAQAQSADQALPQTQQAAAGSGAAAPETRRQADAEALDRLAARGEDPIAEAEEALAKTRNALAALDQGDTDLALEHLAEATGELEILIARRPALALAPADTNVTRREVLGPLQAVRAMRDRIEDLVDNGHLQQARPLMRDFGSEVVLTTANLPLATYADALKAAAAQIEAGEPERASRTLSTALSTIVLTETVVPLPPLRAETILRGAEALVAEAERSPEQSQELRDRLDAARNQIELASELGYGTEDEYDAILDEIDRIEDQAEENPIAQAFAGVRNELSSIFR